MPGHGWADSDRPAHHGRGLAGAPLVMRAARLRLRLAQLAGIVIVAALLAVLPLGLGLPLWSAAVLAGWLYRRQGQDRASDRLLWLSQAGMPGLAVEIATAVGHGAVGVLCGLLSILLQASVLALLFSRSRSPSAAESPVEDWNPLADIGPAGSSYVLQLEAAPATSKAGPRLIPGLESATQAWLWPDGWLLPCGIGAPEQDENNQYAVLAGPEAVLWLLDLRRAKAYRLTRCELAGWRDGRPWFETGGGGRLLSVEDCMASAMPLQPAPRGGLKDLAGLLPPEPGPPEILDRAEAMPAIALQAEWQLDQRQATDPLAAFRQPCCRLCIDQQDTGLKIAAKESSSLRWQRASGRLLIRAVDDIGQSQDWQWQAEEGLQRRHADPSPPDASSL